MNNPSYVSCLKSYHNVFIYFARHYLGNDWTMHDVFVTLKLWNFLIEMDSFEN